MLKGRMKLLGRKRGFVGMLTLVVFISCTSLNVYAGTEQGQETTVMENAEEREEEIQRLISEKVALKTDIMYASENESEFLQQQYEEVCKQLEKLGVSNEILEDIPVSTESSAEVCAILPNFSSFDNLFDVDTYYQYGEVDGKRYKLYNVILTDKDGNSSLSYTRQNSIVVQGSISNENQAKQLEADSIKFVGTAIIAATTVSSPWLGFALSTLVSMIPNYKSEYLIHGNNAVTVDSFTVDEIVRYVYGYDEVNDKWILIHSANRAIVTYLTVMHYKKYAVTDLVSETSRTYMNLEALSTTNNFLAEYLVRAMQDPSTFSILNKIYSSITMKLNLTNGYQHTFPLHGTAEPAFLH